MSYLDPSNYDPATPLGWTPDRDEVYVGLGDFDGGEDEPEPEKEGDPNADLIGKVLTIADREWTIAGTVSWSDSYVILSRPGPEPGLIDGMIRPVAVIRNHLRIVGGAA